VWVYDGKAHALRIVESSRACDTDELLCQRELLSAPAILIMLGQLAASVAHRGTHGYRLLLLRAGAAAHSAWLAALSLGLSGCLFTGLIPSALRRHAGIDGYIHTPLLALAVGKAEGIQPCLS
jgi:hypothetical protein